MTIHEHRDRLATLSIDELRLEYMKTLAAR